jgi:hypothetical protein
MDFDEITRFLLSTGLRVLGIGLVIFISYVAAQSSKWPELKAQLASLAVCAAAALFFGGSDGTHTEQNDDYDGLRSGSHQVVDHKVSKIQQNTSMAKMFIVLAMAGGGGVHYGIRSRKGK